MPPALHVIIEPHPDVLAHMRKLGWFDKPNVRILEGKWQDFVDSEELLGTGGFDVVYTDTFSEDYKGVYLPSGRRPVTNEAPHRPQAVLRTPTRPACRAGVALQLLPRPGRDQ